MIKQDEIKFRRALYNASLNSRVINTADVIASIGMHSKRGWYLLHKLTRKGFIEYGTSITFVWLTDKGREEFKPFDPVAFNKILTSTITSAVAVAFEQKSTFYGLLKR